MKKFKFDIQEYATVTRAAAAESCVLVKNDNNALPIKKGEEVAVFGRIAFDYYKSGLGSGGLVNTRYVVGILDALKGSSNVRVNQELLKIYEHWLVENPFNRGEGWGKVPWSQKEMPLTETMLDLALSADIAIIIIGRTAGEDQDFSYTEGSYLLSREERELIKKVCERFERVAVLLNVGSIIDMNWIEEYKPQAVMYVWQGGQEGGNGVVDVLTGEVAPSGKLTDTIAKTIKDYPSTQNFGDTIKNIYQEDIYVGYRYFETFAKNRVLYPFGYGLSYSTFTISGLSMEEKEDGLEFKILVKNIGEVKGKEVLQVYMEAPQGKLGKPSRVLIGFAKTKMLDSGGEEIICIFSPWKNMASYDDSGITEYKSAFVLEAGAYRFYFGNNVRTNEGYFEWSVGKLRVVERLEEALAPTEAFKRIIPKQEKTEYGEYTIAFESVPLQSKDLTEKKKRGIPKEIGYTGDRKIRLGDVLEQKADIEDFVGQLEDLDMIHLSQGEGMCSSKVTPGTAGAFGGVTDRLSNFGMPIACCADGPSGIRMDSGAMAFSLPNGTALACTFNRQLVEKLYQILGMELRKNKIDTLLGPGMNIHRNPLNGRNFEYCSEDPLLTGVISSAQSKGLADADVSATIKHFVANNQESGRTTVNCIISERALREIYLRGFEIAVKEGEVSSVMTTYGAVNGIWTAGNYDLCTMILRRQWGFDGIVMTDWWAVANDEGGQPIKEHNAPMISAQNDLYMVVPDVLSTPINDNLLEQLAKGKISRSQLQRNSINILKFILNAPIMQHALNKVEQQELEAMNGVTVFDVNEQDVFELNVLDGKAELNLEHIKIRQGESTIFALNGLEAGEYRIFLELSSELDVLAQLPISVFLNSRFIETISMNGTEGATITKKRELGYIQSGKQFLRLFYGADGIKIIKVTVLKKK